MRNKTESKLARFFVEIILF